MSAPVLWVRGHEERHDAIGTKTFGFWLYMMSDALIFAGLFAAYGVLDHRVNAAGGPFGRALMHPVTAFWETVLLFASVLASGFAMAGAKGRSRMLVLLALALAGGLGVVFLCLEARDFLDLARQGAGFDRSAYLAMFWLLVAVHGVHILFGLIWMGVVMVQVAFMGFTQPVVTRLLTLRLFWQFQASVWVCVFVFVYLQGAM